MISREDFEKVDLRIGTILEVQEFLEARKPAGKVHVDFGDEIGVKKSSAQITEHYTKDDILGKQVLAVVIFPPKQIGPFLSECLITGFADKDGFVVLATPERVVHNGSKLF